MNRPMSALACVFLAMAPGAIAGSVVINEIHYKPADKTLGLEFIELYNTGPIAVDLSGWFFSDGIVYEFPAQTLIQADGYAVIAEDPETFEKTFKFAPLGPYEGNLENEGERIVLRNGAGEIEDEVEYKAEFPWPVAPRGYADPIDLFQPGLDGETFQGIGTSMELIHPSLDNDLGGSWRASGLIQRPPRERFYYVPQEDPSWRYRKGTSEASDPPSAWREVDFVEDGTWQTGRTAIGFGETYIKTTLDDMRSSYSSVFFRHTFSIPTADAIPTDLKLNVTVDDGAIIWINGVEVLRTGMADGDAAFDGVASVSREAKWEGIFLQNPGSFLRAGVNVIAIHAFNRSITSTDFALDAELLIPGDEDYADNLFLPPTPGARNSVYSEDAPPHVRQVESFPLQPPAEQEFFVTARITDPDGVASVELSYQVVPPGQYLPAYQPLPIATLLSNANQPLPANPAFEDPANWSTVPMVDDETMGDLVGGDSIWTAVLPAQVNRTLVRYRIRATDGKGNAGTVPYQDDPSLNFACFVYDGVPPYTASRLSVHPEGRGHVYGTDVMNALPVYILVTRKEDFTTCIAYSSSYQIPKSNEAGRDKFNWEGAFVYQGIVHDHVHYRLRQANDRYGGAGKRSFRIRFNAGRRLEAHDNYGRPFPFKWRTINTGKMFDNKDVGNFGLTETMNHLLWNLVGTPAPWTYTFHWRVVQGPDEVPEGTYGQYLGDFYGMHLVFEDYDPRFLDTHALADGNLYKLKDGIFNGLMFKRNQGRYAVTTDQDFQNIRANLRPTQPNSWLDAHVNYPKWYPYHTICEAVRHYDFVPADSHSKNRAWYFEPDYSASQYGRLWTLPWDSDASWGPSWNSGIDYSKNAIFSPTGKESYRMEYRNVMREFRDLIWTEEVIEQMIDDLASFVKDFAMADRDRWRSAPSEAGYQDFGTMEAKVADMKRFAFVGWSGSTGPTVGAGGRAQYMDTLAAAEGEAGKIPATPAIASTAPAGYPIDALTFTSGPFSDPQGDALGAMKWRIGEITPPGTPFDPKVPRIYEYPAIWEEEIREGFSRDIAMPQTVVQSGRMYRVRLRVMDVTGRWSHWSEPVQFTAGPPLQVTPQERCLRVTEVMYHPADDADLEFIEIQNIGSGSVDLAGVRLRGGVRFDFDASDVKTLGPGAYLVLVRNLSVFRRFYDTRRMTIAGEYAGRLDNAGDEIDLLYGETPIVLFAFRDDWHPWTDGMGFSLVARDTGIDVDLFSLRDSWRPSAVLGGSPGGPEGASGLQLPGNLNQSPDVEIGDAILLLTHLFSGEAIALPCGDGSPDHPSNRALLDVNGNDIVEIGDAIHLLNYLFASGAPPALGVECVPLEGCPDVCP
ncbi:MAG: lamin tail domain-containing protein [Planctomycetes bacterium]|nr:lamin tail domain-containing protein [Planctomycetota bacterium]